MNIAADIGIEAAELGSTKTATIGSDATVSSTIHFTFGTGTKPGILCAYVTARS